MEFDLMVRTSTASRESRLAGSCTRMHISADLLQERRDSTTPCASGGITLERGQAQTHMRSLAGWHGATNGSWRALLSRIRRRNALSRRHMLA